MCSLVICPALRRTEQMTGSSPKVRVAYSSMTGPKGHIRISVSAVMGSPTHDLPPIVYHCWSAAGSATTAACKLQLRALHSAMEPLLHLG